MGAQGTPALRPQFWHNMQPRQTSWSEKPPRGFCKPQNCPMDTVKSVQWKRVITEDRSSEQRCSTALSNEMNRSFLLILAPGTLCSSRRSKFPACLEPEEWHNTLQASGMCFSSLCVCWDVVVMFLCNAASTNSTQQLTQFATSIFRRRVSDALDFRNRFAQRPFLPRELIEPENILVSCCYFCSSCTTFLMQRRRVMTSMYISKTDDRPTSYFGKFWMAISRQWVVRSTSYLFLV